VEQKAAGITFFFPAAFVLPTFVKKSMSMMSKKVLMKTPERRPEVCG
jgi:hypothetical protein